MRASTARIHYEPRERGEALRPFPLAGGRLGWGCGVRTTMPKHPAPTLALPLSLEGEGRVELYEFAVPTAAAVTPQGTTQLPLRAI